MREAAAEAPIPPDARIPRWVDALWLTASAVVASWVAYVIYGLHNFKLHTPLLASGDGTVAQALIRTVLDDGWIDRNPRLGAPFGASLQDLVVTFSAATQLMLAKLMGIVSSDPIAIANVLVLLGFPIIAAVTYLVFRDLGFRPVVAAVCAVLYATTTYHFVRGMGHMFLGLYYAVPIAGWLLLGVVGATTLVTRHEHRGGLRSWLTSRNLVTAVAVVIVGTSEIYYAVFALALLAALSPIAAVSRRSWRPLLLGIAVAGGIAVSTVAAQLPTLTFHAKEGANTAVSQRSPAESEIYGLKLSDMVLPASNHRVDALAKFGSDYRSITQLGGEGVSANLGAYTTAGFLFVVLALLAAALAPPGSPRRPRQALAVAAGLAALAAFVLGTMGGGGAVFAYVVDPQVRGWNRISIVIAFFGMVGVGIGLSWVADRMAARGRWGTRLAVPATLVLGIVGLWEQTAPSPIDPSGPPAQFRSDSRFVDAIENEVPPNAMVLQLPYVPFPENPPVNEMFDYEHLRPYVAGSDLRWSYGASRGRMPEDWAAGTQRMSPDELVAGAVAAGFDGIYVNRRAYVDRGAQLVESLAEAIQVPVIASEQEDLVFFNLGPVRERLQAATSADQLRTAGRQMLSGGIIATMASGWYPPEANGVEVSTPGLADTSIQFDNASKGPLPVQVGMRLAAPGPEPSTVNLTWSTGETDTVKIPGGKNAAYSAQVTIPSGGATVSLKTEGPDDARDVRDVRLRVSDITVAGSEISTLARALR